MPRIEFDEGLKKKSNFDYPKLSLDQNEKARVCVLDNPYMEYVHTLRKVITENGQPIMETQKFGRNQERSREVPQTDFVGKFICLGDMDTLKTKEVDPDGCPACKAHLENSGAVDKPRRRFAVHVIKYQTRKGTFNLQEPFQVELMAWEFTEGRYESLTDIRTEHGALNQIDLCLGPCTNKGFQKYDIIPGGSCQWGSDDDRKTKTLEIYKAQRSEDLTPLIGRKVNFAELNSSVQDVVTTYNYAFGRTDALPTPDTNAGSNADSDFSDLLGGGQKTEPEGNTDDPWSPEKTDAPEGGSNADQQQAKGGVEDLDSLLADIN